MTLDLKEALTHARRGADIACRVMMWHYRSQYQVFKKENAGDRAGAVLTEPDLLCDRALMEHFSKLYPDHAIVSEESADTLPGDRREREWIWFIDPIDGSLSYLEGTDNFGVSIGLARRGEPVLGVLRNPAKDLEAWAIKGGGAFVNSQKATLDKSSRQPPRLILSSNQRERRSYKLAIEKLKPDNIVTLESVVTKTILLLQGEGDYYFSLPYEVFGGGCPSAWDLAASVAIVKEAGGTSCDIYGEQILFTGADTKWRRGHIFALPEAYSSVQKVLSEFVEDRKKTSPSK